MSRREIVLKLFSTVTIALSLVGARLQAQTMSLGQEAVNPYAQWDAPFGPATNGTYEHLPVGVASEATPAAVESLPSMGQVGDVGTPVESFEWQPELTAPFRRSQERLIDRVVDPTAWLMNYRFRESWNWPVNNSGRDSEEFQFRPTIPFRAWDHVNIMRVTVPYTVSGPGGPGLGDVEVFDLVVHEEEWGRWGVGPDFRLTPDGSGSFQLGPVAGAVTKDRYWTIGVLTQNFFADDVAETRIQPILAYKFDDEWAVGVGEFEFRYDWEDMDWTQVPFGVEVDYITEVYGQKIHFFVNPQYNFESDSSNSGWTFFIGLSLLVPGA
jgi:hypothetical protein